VKVRLSRLADAEVDETDSWYSARGPELGEEFRAELDRIMGIIGDHPELFPVAFDEVRRAMMKRFPYFVLDEVFPTEVVVFGVIHAARDPNWWSTQRDA